MPAGLIMVAAGSGALLLANEQASRILRRPFDGWASAPLLEGLHPDGQPYQPEQWPLYRALHAGEMVNNEEIQLLRGDGSRAWVLMSAGPVRDRGGAVVAGLVEFQEITERRQLEDELRHSQKMEAIGRLAGGVAHDFNNLLTIIGGYGQMLLDSVESKNPIHGDLEAIVEAANRASALTRHLLAFSRRQIIQPKVLDLNRLITRMNRMLRPVIGEDIELRLELNADPGRVKADPGHLEQVIMNLVVNARDAMPTGGALTISTGIDVFGPGAGRAGMTAGTYVLLSISDTGSGIDPEIRDQVFEPFFTTKPKGRGTGLGLSTVYGIVKQSGGEIALESELGVGTTFRIWLPQVERNPRAFRSTPRRIPGRGTETILLVEDEPEVRKLAREMLTRLGYQVFEAADGVEALAIWERHAAAIDLVLTDVIMPGMGGRELADALRKRSPAVRVLFMSGYTEDVIAQHGVTRAGLDLVQKPFTREQLGVRVRQALDGGRD
jgi:PAS domain S-box-containing protein